MTTPTSCLKESHRNWILCICAARHSDTELSAWDGTLSLRRNSAHLCRECCSCCSPVCPGCSWPSSSLVGILKQKQAPYDFSLYFFSLIPILFYSLLRLCFLIFPAGSSVVQIVTEDQPYISSQAGEVVTLNCHYETHRSSYIFGINNFPVERWFTLLVRFPLARMQGMAATLQIFRDHINPSASPFQTYSWKTLQSTSAPSGNSVLEVIEKAEQNPQSVIRESPPAEEPRLKYTPADPRQEMVVLRLLHLWSGSEDLILKESSLHVIWKQMSRVIFYWYILLLNFWL